MPTEISWTDETWNPTSGCDRVSPGCDNCYALTLAKRLKGMGQAKYQRDGDPRTSGPGFGLTMHADTLGLPLRWRKPRRVFVNSMSDLFHPDVPFDFICRVWATMTGADIHTFQVLTKRPQRMAQILAGDTMRHIINQELGYTRAFGSGWPLSNVWLGVSVENQRYADLRIPHLLATPAAVRFLSIEPLLGPVDLMAWLHGGFGRAGDHDELDWVIIGGESGPGARPMEIEWAESIVEQCRAAGVAVFVKQLGTVRGGKQHHDIDTFPESLRVREYPQETAT